MLRNIRKIESFTATVVSSDITDSDKFNIASGDPQELVGVPVILEANTNDLNLAKIAPYKGVGALCGVVRSVTEVQTAYDNIGSVYGMTVSVDLLGDSYSLITSEALAAGDKCGINAEGKLKKGTNNVPCYAIQPAKSGDYAYVIMGVYSQDAVPSQ